MKYLFARITPAEEEDDKHLGSVPWRPTTWRGSLDIRLLWGLNCVVDPEQEARLEGKGAKLEQRIAAAGYLQLGHTSWMAGVMLEVAKPGPDGWTLFVDPAGDITYQPKEDLI